MARRPRASKLSEGEQQQLAQADATLRRFDSIDADELARRQDLAEAMALTKEWRDLDEARDPAAFSEAWRRMEGAEAAREREQFGRTLSAAERELVAQQRRDLINQLASDTRAADAAEVIADRRADALARRQDLLGPLGKGGGEKGGENRRKQQDVDDREVVSEAIALVEERDRPCGDGCERPCTLHRPRNGWSQYVLAKAVCKRCADNGDARFASEDGMRKRLGRLWPVLYPVLLRLPQHLDECRQQAAHDPGADLDKRARDNLAELILDADSAVAHE